MGTDALAEDGAADLDALLAEMPAHLARLAEMHDSTGWYSRRR